MRILITNVYSWRNKGDAAIVLGLLCHVKETYPGAEICLSSQDPDDQGKYGNYSVAPSLLSLLRDAGFQDRDSIRSRFAVALAGIAFRFALSLFQGLRTLGISAWWLFPRTIVDKLRTYESSDLVIACGGGYLLTTTASRKLERVMRHSDLLFVALEFALAKVFEKPYILYNQSIGPFHSSADERLVRSMLEGASAIFCREELTFARLQDWGLSNIRPCADAAFALEARVGAMPAALKPGIGEGAVGLTVRACLPAQQQAKYETEIRRFLTRYLRRHDSTRAFFLPQVIYSKVGDDDRVVARRVHAGLPRDVRSRVILIEAEFHPGELKAHIAELDLFIGTRMHSNIFALSSLVKTVAISYEPKTEGIMRMLGMSEYVLPAAELRAEGLLAMVERLEDDQRYHERLRRVLAHVSRHTRPGLRNSFRADTATRTPSRRTAAIPLFKQLQRSAETTH